jgi:DNA processing protein
MISAAELDESDALLILSSCRSLGLVKIKLLVNQLGSAVNALCASAEEIAAILGDNQLAAWWKEWSKDPSWAGNLSLVGRYGVDLLAHCDDRFPPALKQLPDGPLLLYARGSLLPADSRSIAIVGTRQPSIYGQEMAHRFARELAGYGFTIISGLARGIDTAAHLGALEQGRTIAFIGSGLSKIYPTENLKLAEKIASTGALLTEFPMATPPDRQNFPQRNRLVSGMALATLLIEAPIKSGAMITMNKALAYGKPIFAIPGRLDSDSFCGNHHLLKEGYAQLVENGGDIARHFDTLFSLAQPRRSEFNPTIALDKEELELLQWLPNCELSIEEITANFPMPIAQLNALLMSLVLKRAVKEFPGRIYKKLWRPHG